jgi:hypothetical protein
VEAGDDVGGGGDEGQDEDEYMAGMEDAEMGVDESFAQAAKRRKLEAAAAAEKQQQV